MREKTMTIPEAVRELFTRIEALERILGPSKERDQVPHKMDLLERIQRLEINVLGYKKGDYKEEEK